MEPRGIKAERRRCSLVFFGSPLIDVVARVDGNFMDRYKLKSDAAYAVDQSNAGIFEEIRRTSSLQVGGSVTNTVRAFVKLKPLPQLITYLGTVGKDEFGFFLIQKLGKLGENLSQVDEETGKVAVLLNGKARTLVTDLGASKNFHLDSEKWTKIGPETYIYFSAFFISVSYSTITDVIENAHKTIIFNLGATFLCEKYSREMTRIYTASSIIFGNESEHRCFAKAHNLTARNLKEAVLATANHLLGNKSRVVVVTRGGGSVFVLLNSDWLEFEVSPLSEDEVVNTNGAGDAFVGGFLARYVDGESIAECVRSGIEIARCAIQGVGFNDE